MSEFENHVFDVWNRFVRNLHCYPEEGCERWCDGENTFYAKQTKMLRVLLIISMKRPERQYLLLVFMTQKKINEWGV